MATQTPYFGLTKSGGIEAALIGVYNNNMDIIDLEIWQSMVRAAINLAPIYDETEAYVEGDYCTILETIQQTVTGFHLYKCTTDTTDPAGTFDPNSWSEVDITSEMGHGGGGGGGHIYLDNSGNVMSQRTKAKFEGAYTTDNGTNDITNVAVMRSMHHADFEQLSDAEKQGIIFVDDETGAVEDKFQPVIYSEDEREIGVWTDGKPLYQKTIITDGQNISSGNTTITHGISNLDTTVSIEGFVNMSWSGNGGEPLFSNALEANQFTPSWGITVKDISNTTITFSIGSNRYEQGIDNVVITLRYTKTTDTAGSGQWTPQGVPAVHYSTTEQLVGTYHDEPLYQKDIEISLADSSDMQTFAPGTLGIGPIKVIIDAYFENSGDQQLRMSRWYGNDYWSYIVGSNGGIMIKRNASDPNWTTGVHFIATVQYTKESS